MNRNYTPYLKFSEFEEDIKSCHFKTENAFFEIQKNYNSTESTNKNYKNIVKRHLSEYEAMIPPDNFDNNENEYNNTIFLEKRDFSGTKKNFGYSLNNIHFNNTNYKKYITFLKNENNYHSKPKRSNKKSNSKNKNILNSEMYNIIQIYEAPPLELTPIMEIEKNEEKRKPPKYYRKKIIYSLEEENEKNNEKEHNINEKRNNFYKYKNNNAMLRKTKLSNSKINEEIINNNMDKTKAEKDEKKYLNYSVKENNKNPDIKKNDDININYKRRDIKNYYKNEKENLKAKKVSTDNINNNDKKDEISDAKKEKEKDDIEIKIKEDDINKKIKKKNYVSKRNNRFSNKLEENQKIIEVNKEEAKNEIINEKNKINFKENYRIKFKNNIIINDNLKKKSENKNEINIENNINENNKIIKKPINLEIGKQQKDENKLIKNDKEKKINEIKTKNEEQKEKEKEIESKNNITKKDYLTSNKKEDNKNFAFKNKLNIDVDKTQLSNTKKSYLINKGDKEGASMKNIKSKKIENDNDSTLKNKNQNNNYSKYVYSFSVEKRNPNEIKEEKKNPIEKKKNDINIIQNIQNKNNEQKEKEQKNVYDFKSQIRTANNNNFLTICIKKDNDNNKENKLDNKDKIRKEINISKINNTNLASAEKNNYTYISTLNYTSKKENEKYNNNNNIKENSSKNILSKNNNLNRVSKMNNEDKKENKINLSNLENNIEIEMLKQNNLKTLNSTSYKNSNRINYNYIAIKSTIPKAKSKADKVEQPINFKNINNKEVINNIKNNTSIKEVSSNLSSSNITLQKKMYNNALMNKISIENEKKPLNENNNLRLTLKIPSIKTNDEIIQDDENENQQKKKITTGKMSNHTIKVSYDSGTFKIPADKKEKVNEIKDKDKDLNNNINFANGINLKSKYSNYKILYNTSSNTNKADVNNIKTEENKINKSTIDNNSNDKPLKEIKTKNNHTLYVSINSKK